MEYDNMCLQPSYMKTTGRLKQRSLSILFLCILVTSICSCSKHKVNTIRTIDLTGDLNRTENLYLSAIASKIDYIKLESGPASYISQIDQIKIGKKFIIIKDNMQDLLFLFDINGKFIRRISNKGNGPLEYNKIHCIDFDEEEKFIYITTYNGYIKKFSIEGEFVKSLKLQFIPGIVDYWNKENFALIFPYPSNLRFDNFTFGKMKFDGQISQKFLKRNLKILTETVPQAHPTDYFYYDTLCFWEKYCDTIYGVTKDNKLIPRWYLKDRQTSKSETENIQKVLALNPKNGDLYVYGFIESPTQFFIKAVYGGKRHYMIYNKESSQCYKLPITQYEPGYINDLDGGFPFFPNGFYDGKLYQVIETSTLKQLKSEGYLSKIPIKDLNSAKVLENLLLKIDINDNPMITIVTLK